MNGKYVDKKWVAASQEEKAVAEKTLKILMGVPDAGTLSNEERALLINRKPKIAIKKGFFERVCNYADNIEQLFAIFKIIDPVDFPSHVKFGVSDSLSVRNTRLIEAAKEIIGVEEESE